MTSNEVSVHIRLKNRKALSALRYAADFIAEKCEGSWNSDDQKALRAIRYAVKRLTVESCETCLDRVAENIERTAEDQP